MDYMEDIAEFWIGDDDRIKEVVFQANYSPLVVMKGGTGDHKISRRRKDSGVADIGKEVTIDTYQAMNAVQAKALQSVRSFYSPFKSDMLPRIPKNGLYIYGSNGTGKTYLTYAIANSLMKRFDLIMATTVEINDKIRRAEFETGATSNRAKDKYKYFDILIIDDIGKQKLNEFQVNNLFDIIDYRSSNLLPTIFTSNYGSQGLIERLTPDGSDESTASSIIDRLNGMCKVIKMEGDSLRK